MWADRNLEAAKREDAGLYNSWGNIFGSQAGQGYNFSQEVYDQTPAAAIRADLTAEQDIVTHQMGNQYRMPSVDDFSELNNNCTKSWTTLNGKRGVLFTSNINGNSIFLPAAGYYNGSSLVELNVRSFYWSINYLTAESCYCAAITQNGIEPNRQLYRREGFLIRPVMAPASQAMNLDVVPTPAPEEPDTNNSEDDQR